MALLFDEEYLRKAVEAEDKVDSNIGAGLDWGWIRLGFSIWLFNAQSRTFGTFHNVTYFS